MNTQDSSLRRNPGGQPPTVLTRLATELRYLPKGKSATRPVEFLPQRNYIHTKVPNQPPNHHDTPASFKPISRIYFPPHHRSHQANPLKRREQTFLTNSDKSSTSCNSIPVPTPFPQSPCTIRIHPYVLPLPLFISMVLYLVFYCGTILYVLCSTYTK